MIDFLAGARLLLKHKANPNLQMQLSGLTTDLTPLHLAIMGAGESGREQFVSILLKHGADPTIPDSRGRNAAHYAVMHVSAPMLRILLSHFADRMKANDAEARKTVQHLLTHKDNTGYTALDVANLPPVYVDLAQLIQSFCAKHELDCGQQASDAGHTGITEELRQQWKEAPRGGTSRPRPRRRKGISTNNVPYCVCVLW